MAPGAVHFGRGHVLSNLLGRARRLLYRRGLRRAELWGYVSQGLREALRPGRASGSPP